MSGLRIDETVEVLLPITTTAGAYSANDVIGGALRFDVKGSGRIERLILHDTGNVKAALRLWLFRNSVAGIADNGPFALSKTDWRLLLGYIDIAAGDYTASIASLTVAQLSPGFRYTASPSLYGYLMCTGTPTYTTTGDLHLALYCLPDAFTSL